MTAEQERAITKSVLGILAGGDGGDGDIQKLVKAMSVVYPHDRDRAWAIVLLAVAKSAGKPTP